MGPAGAPEGGSVDERTYSHTRMGSPFVKASVIGLVDRSNAVNGIWRVHSLQYWAGQLAQGALNDGLLASPSVGQSHISFGPIVLWRYHQCAYQHGLRSPKIRWAAAFSSVQRRMVYSQQNVDKNVERMHVVRACEMLDGD